MATIQRGKKTTKGRAAVRKRTKPKTLVKRKKKSNEVSPERRGIIFRVVLIVLGIILGIIYVYWQLWVKVD